MTTTTAIQRYTSPMPLAEMGKYFATSGYFSDAREAAQAIVKIQAGRELGFGPVASMTGIFIVKNKVTMSATIMAAAIKKSRPLYDYKLLELTDQSCVIEFYENGKAVGKSPFTMADAKKAGLDRGDNYKNFPRNMLFARAMSNGAKWFCPDVFHGNPVYTPDELGMAVDDEGDPMPIIDAQPSVPAPAPAPAPSTLPPPPAVPPKAQPDLSRLEALIAELAIPEDKITAWCDHFKVERLEQLSQEEADAIVKRVESTISGDHQ